MKTVSKEAAKNFLVDRQFFLQDVGKDGTLEAIRRLECVQIDPIKVVHRNHHLVLHNRVSDYKPSYLNTLLYKNRAVFEYWCNEKSIIPMEDFRYFYYHMQHSMEFHSPFYERLKARREEFKEATRKVVAAIKAHGALCAQDFRDNVGSKTANRVLYLLWDSGIAMIDHVEGNRRYYDLSENILPKNLDDSVPSKDEHDRFMVEKYIRAYGLVDVRDWRFGWLPLKSVQRKAITKKMVKDGMLFPVRIEGIKQVYYILEKHLGDLEAAEGSSIEEKVLLIAPLDNLIWNRRMISEVFGFDYAWEVYKVPEKRKYGYYVLPILYGANFVGRIDPKLDRANKTMIINSVLLEKARLAESFIVELAATLKKFVSFHNASQVKIMQTKPVELKKALLSEINRLD